MRIITSCKRENGTNVWFNVKLNRFTLRFVTVLINSKRRSVKLRRRELLPLFGSIKEYVEKNGNWVVVEVDDGQGEHIEVEIVK